MTLLIIDIYAISTGKSVVYYDPEWFVLAAIIPNVHQSRWNLVGICCCMEYNWRAQWKNRICSTTMKLRKSRVKPVTRQKTCNYIQLFGTSAQDRHARRI